MIGRIGAVVRGVLMGDWGEVWFCRGERVAGVAPGMMPWLGNGLLIRGPGGRQASRGLFSIWPLWHAVVSSGVCGLLEVIGSW